MRSVSSAHNKSNATPSESKPAKAAGSVLAFLIVIEVASGFVQGYYTPLLPRLAAHVGVSGEAMNWFQTAQAMTAAIVVPLMSKLGDLYGPRRILRVAIASVFIGTLLIALVPSYPVVLIGRIFVGPQGVWLPLAIAIIYVRLSGQSATRAITILSASLMGGVVLGTFAAGITDALLPNLVLALLVPPLIILISSYGVFFKIPADIDLGTGKVDWLGFAGLGAVMISIIFTLAHIGPEHVRHSIVLLLATAAVFGAWIYWERKVQYPAVELSLVVSRSIGPLYVTAFVMGVLIIDVPSNLADFLSRDPETFGYGFHASTSTISGLIATLLICATAGAFASSFIAAKFGMRRMLITATLMGAVGQLLMVLMPHVFAAFWVSGLLTGLGVGVLSGALPAMVSHAAPEGKTGIANGLYAALLAMGGAVGGAVFRKVLMAFRDSTGITELGGFLTIWIICIALFLLAATMLTLVQIPSSSKVDEQA